MSQHDLSRLFSAKSPQVELVLAKRGPFTGKRMRIGANDRPQERRSAALSIAEFAERNQVRFYTDKQLAFLTGEATEA
jgi:hypothetical protein